MKIAEMVKRGAKLLDDRRPNWWKMIEPKRLNMLSCTDCILGQVYEGEGLDVPWGRGYKAGKQELGIEAAHKYGFSDDEARWTTLRRAWLTLIRSRYTAAAKRMK